MCRSCVTLELFDILGQDVASKLYYKIFILTLMKQRIKHIAQVKFAFMCSNQEIQRTKMFVKGSTHKLINSTIHRNLKLNIILHLHDQIL